MQYNNLEAYIAAKICFDPSLDPNQIIDEYFKNYYGAAGETMKKFYREIEQAYWDYNNYPQNWFRSDKVMGPRGKKNPTWGTGLHSPSVNWGIGTVERVEKLDGMIKKAKTLVKTPAEKARLRMLIDGIWAQAVKGRKEYAPMLKVKAIALRPFAFVPTVNDLGGDAKTDWSKAVTLDNWVNDVKHNSRIQLLRDSKYLYLKYSEDTLPENVHRCGRIAWKCFLPRRRPFRRFRSRFRRLAK